MELIFKKSDWATELKPTEIKVILNKADEILSDRLSPKSATILYVDFEVITVEYEGENHDKVKYSQTADFYHKKNMQYFII